MMTKKNLHACFAKKLEELKQSESNELTLDLSGLDLADAHQEEQLEFFLKTLLAEGFTLQHLNLSRCQLGNMRNPQPLLCALKPVLASNATLDLSGNYLGGMGTLRFIELLRSLPAIQTLHLGTNDLYLFDKALADVFSAIPATRLDLSNNALLEHEETKLALRTLPNRIRALALSNTELDPSHVALQNLIDKLLPTSIELIHIEEKCLSVQSYRTLELIQFEMHYNAINNKITSSDYYFANKESAEQLLGRLAQARHDFLHSLEPMSVKAPLFQQECTEVITELNKNLSWRALLEDILAKFLAATHLKHSTKGQGRARFGLFPAEERLHLDELQSSVKACVMNLPQHA